MPEIWHRPSQLRDWDCGPWSQCIGCGCPGYVSGQIFVQVFQRASTVRAGGKAAALNLVSWSTICKRVSPRTFIKSTRMILLNTTSSLGRDTRNRYGAVLSLWHTSHSFSMSCSFSKSSALHFLSSARFSTPYNPSYFGWKNDNASYEALVPYKGSS